MARDVPVVWLSPPEVEEDGPSIGIDIGTGRLTPQNKSFSIHLGRLESVSSLLQASNDDSKVSLITRCASQTFEPVAFQALYDWIYQKSSFGRGHAKLSSDCYWAMVFDMAVRWRVPHLAAIAFDRFSSCFRPIKRLSDLSKSRVSPSQDTIKLVFNKDRPIAILKSWVLDHTYWHYNKASPALEDLECLFKAEQDFAVDFACRLCQGKLGEERVEGYMLISFLPVRLKQKTECAKTCKEHPNEVKDWLVANFELLQTVKAENRAPEMEPTAEYEGKSLCWNTHVFFG